MVGVTIVSQAWIFQSHPDRFRIEAFFDQLRRMPTDTLWLVQEKFQNSVKPGDEVYIWRAVGRDNATAHLAGVIAKGRVTDEVKEQIDDPRSIPYWVDPTEGTKMRPRVAIRIEAYTSTKDLRREAIKINSDLMSMSIMRFHQGTNFKITAKEAAAIEALF